MGLTDGHYKYIAQHEAVDPSTDPEADDPHDGSLWTIKRVSRPKDGVINLEIFELLDGTPLFAHEFDLHLNIIRRPKLDVATRALDANNYVRQQEEAQDLFGVDDTSPVDYAIIDNALIDLTAYLKHMGVIQPDDWVV